jgi:16S rRNA (guanine1207-N2)-methyltransferase
LGEGFATVLLRATKSKEELRMDRHAAASVLEPGGALLVYGAKDEGIRAALGSVGEAGEPFFSEPQTLGVGGRCRVLAAGRTEDNHGLRGRLSDWREVVTLDHRRLPDPWVSYPGVFSHPRLDQASRLLVDSLPPLPPEGRVLDFGCGSGVVAAVARGLVSGVEVEALDVDAVALEALRENVPGARTLLRDGLPPRGTSRYDAILSNPPFHRGKAEDTGLLHAMIQEAPGLLGKEGHLVFVTQRRLPAESVLESTYRQVSILAEEGAFRVWWARFPRLRRGGRP